MLLHMLFKISYKILHFVLPFKITAELSDQSGLSLLFREIIMNFVIVMHGRIPHLVV